VDFARREFSFLRLAQNGPPGVITRAEQALAALPPVSAETVEPDQAETNEAPAEPAPSNETEETPE